ncbi:LysR family transcriptional regulator, partial [Vibrio metschnikovii]|nr:LysR family transcriptional regulator [Vibrio metschnikovii]
KKLGEERVYLYGTREYLQPFVDVGATKDLRDLQIIGFGNNSRVIEQFAEHGWRLVEDNFKISTEFQPAQLELCKNHLGLMYLPEDIAKQEPRLKQAPESLFPMMQIPLWIVCHEELRTNLRVRRVFDRLAEEFAILDTP